MKKIFLSLIILISLQSFGQDSSSQRIDGIILKGKDCDIIARFVKFNISAFSITDSVLKAIYVNPPGNNADVTFNSIPRKEWLRMYFTVGLDRVSLIQGVYTRVKAELNLHGGQWMIHRIGKGDLIIEAEYDSAKKEGQKYAKKDDDEIIN